MGGRGSNGKLTGKAKVGKVKPRSGGSAESLGLARKIAQTVGSMTSGAVGGMGDKGGST